MDARPDPLNPGPPPEWRGEDLIFLVHQVLSRAADCAPGRLFPEKTPGHVLHIALIDLREDPGAELERLLGFLDLPGGPELVGRMLDGMGALPLYGHFAAAEGGSHREPSGFRRPEKGRLGPARRLLVHLICQPYKGRLGY